MNIQQALASGLPYKRPNDENFIKPETKSLLFSHEALLADDWQLDIREQKLLLSLADITDAWDMYLKNHNNQHEDFLKMKKFVTKLGFKL